MRSPSSDRIAKAIAFHQSIDRENKYTTLIGRRQNGAQHFFNASRHQAGGPDLETNGLALCRMHHKLFDRGAFTLTDELQLCVSQKANGSIGLSEWLTSFHGLPLKAPQSRDYLPLNEHLEWHRKEVFHGPGRELNPQP